MNILKHLKNSVKRGAEMVVEVTKEALSTIPCDKKLIANIIRDILVGAALANVLIANDYSSYAKRIPDDI